MARSKKQEGQIVTLDKLRDNLVIIAQEIKKGNLTPSVGNAVVNAYRASIYAEQVRLSHEDAVVALDVGAKELSRADKARLDEICKLLSEK